MIKFQVTRSNSHEAPEVAEVHAPVMARVAQAIRHAPTEHRILSFLLFAAIWALLEYVLHYEMAAKGAELFGLAPAADKLLKLVIGED